MNVLAVIPARSGSVGVPHKNIRQCGGKPLMAWSIEAALASRYVTRVVVSSDSEAYLNVARAYGADGVLRPADLAGPESHVDYAIRHAAEAQAERPEWIVTLQPTVPDRRDGLIDDCLRRAWETDADALFTAEAQPYVWWRTDKGAWAHEAVWESNNPQQVNRQQLSPRDLVWKQDGSVYVSRACLLLQEPNNRRPPRKLGGIIQVYPNDWSLDIDTEEQFLAADAMMAAKVAAERTVA